MMLYFDLEYAIKLIDLKGFLDLIYRIPKKQKKKI